MEQGNADMAGVSLYLGYGEKNERGSRYIQGDKE